MRRDLNARMKVEVHKLWGGGYLDAETEAR